jgi:hypothetical protein
VAVPPEKEAVALAEKARDPSESVTEVEELALAAPSPRASDADEDEPVVPMRKSDTESKPAGETESLNA